MSIVIHTGRSVRTCPVCDEDVIYVHTYPNGQRLHVHQAMSDLDRFPYLRGCLGAAGEYVAPSRDVQVVGRRQGIRRRPMPWNHAETSWTQRSWIDETWARWPRVCRAVQWLGVLNPAETAIALRSYVERRDMRPAGCCSSEAVEHYGGPDRIVRHASYRHTRRAVRSLARPAA